MQDDIADLRRDYKLASLEESDAGHDPLALFRRWFEEARSAQLPEPNAMTLATVTPDGGPDARIVLLKGLDERGFVFFTNYESRKGEELATRPRAALVFHWTDLERQVRVEGEVERIAADESDAYYRVRPLGSRIGAWASPQSRVIPDRDVLDTAVAEAQARFGDDPPRPPHWGGYRVLPRRLEFWQGRPSRLHDRLLCTLQDGGGWRIERLAP